MRAGFQAQKNPGNFLPGFGGLLIGHGRLERDHSLCYFNRTHCSALNSFQRLPVKRCIPQTDAIQNSRLCVTLDESAMSVKRFCVVTVRHFLSLS
jgi:hypothetical protein